MVNFSSLQRDNFLPGNCVGMYGFDTCFDSCCGINVWRVFLIFYILRYLRQKCHYFNLWASSHTKFCTSNFDNQNCDEKIFLYFDNFYPQISTGHSKLTNNCKARRSLCLKKYRIIFISFIAILCAEMSCVTRAKEKLQNILEIVNYLFSGSL